MGIGCAPPPPDAGGAGAGCVPPPDGAAVGCAAAGVGCGARVGAAPDEPPDGAVGCAVGCAPLCPMNGRLPQPLSRRAPMIRTVDGKSRALNETSLHNDTFLHQQTWRLSQTPCKRTMVERRIEHRIVRNDHLLQRWKRGSGRRHGCSSRFLPVRIQGRGKHAQSPGVLTGVEPGGRGRTLPESRPHAATEMNFGLREKYAEIYSSSHRG
jgi:hypothetical protein